jgi:hypothetical protein
MRFRKRRLDVERELRRNRPEPRVEFLAALEARIREGERSRAGFRRVGFALAFTSAIVVALAAVGGIGQAASTLKSAVQSVTRIAEPLRAVIPEQADVTAAADQYRRVRLCHRGEEIVVDENAVPAHVGHGDTIGGCPAFTPPTIGTAGNDRIEAGRGNNIVRAGAGNDVVSGGRGNDVILGGAGDDRLGGGRGNDRLVGGGGRNRLFGGAGNDVIDVRNGRGGDLANGGIGFDVCLGDRGDRFISCEIIRRS